MSDKLIKLKVITPVKMLFEGEVKSFIVKTRGEVGEFAVLADHAPMTATIGIGSLVLEMPDGAREVTSLFGGYVVVQNNSAVIVAEAAEWPGEIDVERAERAKERAEARLKKSGTDVDRAQAALMRAMERIEIYKLRK